MASKKSAKKAPKIFTGSQEAAEEGRIGTMGRAEDMRKLAEDTINSFDTREVARVALKQEVATTLHGFRQELKTVQMDLRRKAADLKRFLGNASASRMRDFQALHRAIGARLEAIKAHQEERNREVAGMIGGFRRDREAAAGHWHHMAGTMAKRRAGVTR
jgi:DNA-binding transcriptional MocR family regulator